MLLGRVARVKWVFPNRQFVFSDVLSLADLQAFIAVSRMGGINRAADSLHRAQSSITGRIKTIEDKLGAQLFVREGRAMQLAPAGRVLLEYAERIVSLADEAAEAVKRDRPTGLLRLGTVESTAAARLPQPLGVFHATYPEVALEIYSDSPLELLRKVLATELDAALIPDPISDKHLTAAVIYEEELVVISEAKHPPIHSPKELRQTTVLAFHTGCPYRQRLEDWFTRSRVCLPRVVEVSSYHVILACVSVGMGISLIPISVLPTFVDRSQLAIHRLHRGFRRAHTKLVWRKESPQAAVLALKAVLLGH